MHPDLMRNETLRKPHAFSSCRTAHEASGTSSAPSLQAALLWQGVTGTDGRSLRSPHAAAFYTTLDWSHCLGWPPHKPTPTNYATFLRHKQAHAQKIIAVRLNWRQHFSVIGVDAVIVTELLELKGDLLAGKCVSCLHC